MIHDAQLDYYGRRLATCASDKTVRVFEVEAGNQQRLVETLRQHDGPVWQVAWAHPRFGTILASCSYDGQVILWGDFNGRWEVIYHHRAHEASVNSIAWAPHEFGAILACASSDGKVSTVTQLPDGQWESSKAFNAHAIGCNAVSWAPVAAPLLLPGASQTAAQTVPIKRIATGGCDNLVKIWRYRDEDRQWVQESVLDDGHQDWVRDVAWAPSLGLPGSTLATCSQAPEHHVRAYVQDKHVLIWSKEREDAPWTKVPLRKDKFPDVVWRLSWSVTGTILAVSSGDNKVSLWKESLEGEWECVNETDKL